MSEATHHSFMTAMQSLNIEVEVLEVAITGLLLRVWIKVETMVRGQVHGINSTIGKLRRPLSRSARLTMLRLRPFS